MTPVLTRSRSGTTAQKAGTTLAGTTPGTTPTEMRPDQHRDHCGDHRGPPSPVNGDHGTPRSGVHGPRPCREEVRAVRASLGRRCGEAGGVRLTLVRRGAHALHLVVESRRAPRHSRAVADPRLLRSPRIPRTDRPKNFEEAP